MKKENLKNKKGITLIALVVTIVVLLILAGVSIAMLSGENGIITQAQEAKENTRGGEVKEYIKLVANENKMVNYTTGTKKDKQDVIDQLVADKKLTSDEVELLETEDEITIGNVVIDFSILGETEIGKTIGDIYSEEMIGKTINYTSDTTLPEGTEWIVLGEDKDGTIMLTTSKPIEEGFTVDYETEAWLRYEDDLHEACSIYGTTIQGKEVIARSMTLFDIFRVIGWGEPPLGQPPFNEYTFGDTLNLDNKQIDVYHPDAESDNFWSKEEIKYDLLDYENYWLYEEDETMKNVNLICGENADFNYALASRMLRINLYENHPEWNHAQYYGCLVDGNKAGCNTYTYHFCTGNVDGFSTPDGTFLVSVRPIVNLPTNIQVEELNGEWQITD